MEITSQTISGTAPSFKFHTMNRNGRDYIVGDIHGMFSALDEMLDQIHFDEDSDRLFSVGDLIDRGPESVRALEFLRKPWFHAVLGNHEQMLLDAQHDDDMYANWVTYNGGAWWDQIDAKTKTMFRIEISKLPIAIEVQSAQGRIGIVHADMMRGYSWREFVTSLDNDPELRDYSIWSRNRYKHYLKSGKGEYVDGLDLLVFGHTPVKHPVMTNNLCFLDTGAPYVDEKNLAKLSILEINPDLKLHQISTLEKKSWHNWITA